MWPSYICYCDQGESPRIIFDIITTRFEPGYYPTIIYDASCRLKELGLNRELEIFSNFLITSDPLHIFNHTRCNESFVERNPKFSYIHVCHLRTICAQCPFLWPFTTSNRITNLKQVQFLIYF